MNEIKNNILKYKYSLSSEKELQKELFDFSLKKLGFIKEYRLSKRDIIDFYHPELKIGIEVKIKGSSSEIYRQVKEYCKYPEINQLLLVSNKAMGLPPEIEEKHVEVLLLGKIWL